MINSRNADSTTGLQVTERTMPDASLTQLMKREGCVPVTLKDVRVEATRPQACFFVVDRSVANFDLSSINFFYPLYPITLTSTSSSPNCNFVCSFH